MTAKPSPHTFETKAEMAKRLLDKLRAEEAVANAVASTASLAGIFELVDIDPVVPVARDIVGNPDFPDDAKKVIPIEELDQTITVVCPKLVNHTDEDQAYAFLIRRGDNPEFPEDPVLFGPIIDTDGTPDDWQLPLYISRLGITDGQDLQLELYVGQGSDISNSYVSNVYRIRFDRRVPGNVPDFAHVDLPDEYLENGVTRAQIEADGGFRAALLAYFGFEPDDDTWLVFTVVATGDVYEYHTGQIPEPGHVLDVLVPLAFFESNNIDGRVRVALKARDVAGNENTGSPHEVNLLIGRSPSGFQPIEVPQHDLDQIPNLIDLQDARTPPEFVVPYYDTPIAGDMVTVSINGGAYMYTLPAIIGAPGDPVAIGPIPTAVIEEIGAGTNGQFTFLIDYSINRDGFIIPANLPRTIACDLRASGWGTELVKGIVRGPNSPADDEIPPEDSTGPLTGTIPHLALDGSEAFETNDRITLYKVNMDGTGAIPLGPSMSATAGVDLAYSITAGLLTNGTNYVRYDNFRAHTPGADNTELSPIWPVNVVASSGLPGGGTPIGFDHWLFRDARQRIMSPGIIQPSMNLRRARGNIPGDGTRFLDVIVRIHHYANMARDDKIVVTVQGFDNRTASGTPAFTQDLPEYTVTDVDVGGSKDTAINEDALTGNELPPFTEERPPANEEKRFADIRIPYDPVIRQLRAGGIIGVGSIRVSFAITNSQGTGVSDTTSTLFLDVDARTAS